MKLCEFGELCDSTAEGTREAVVVAEGSEDAQVRGVGEPAVIEEEEARLQQGPLSRPVNRQSRPTSEH